MEIFFFLKISHYTLNTYCFAPFQDLCLFIFAVFLLNDVLTKCTKTSYALLVSI